MTRTVAPFGASLRGLPGEAVFLRREPGSHWHQVTLAGPNATTIPYRPQPRNSGAPLSEDPLAPETAIAVFGVGIWPNRLATSLVAAADATNRSIDVTAHGPEAIIPWLGAGSTCDIAVRVGLRPGAATPRGLAFDAAWSTARNFARWRHEVVYWIGTDVHQTVSNQSRYTNWKLQRTRGIKHLAAAPWLTDSLRSFGISAQTHYFPLRLHSGPVAPLPETLPLRILTYLPQDRWEFYGAPGLLKAAVARPDSIHLTIVGSAQAPSKFDIPPNVSLLGWVPDLGSHIDKSHVVARLVRHDAFGGTAVEALSRGRHLIYTYPVDGAYHVPFGDLRALDNRIDELVEALSNGSLLPNVTGVAAVSDRDYIADALRLLETITSPDCDRPL